MSQHRVARRKLGRKTEHRIATLRNLACALLEHERIETTLYKAKDLRSFAEKLISRARHDSVHSRRVIARTIHDRDIVRRLFYDIAPRFIDRPGGFTRIMRTMPRKGDAAEMAIIELVVRKEKEAPKAPETGEQSKKKAGGLGGLARRLTGRKKAAAAE
jgi:large subunit ribosomal protein L17